MMPEAIHLLLGLTGGLALGLLSFGGLWLTIKRLPGSARPYRLYYTSKLVRLALVLAGLFALLQLHPAALGAGVLGVYAARLFLLRTHLERTAA